MSDLDWSRWPDFSESEFACRCATCKAAPLKVTPMDSVFLDKLQEIRTAVGFPMKITSGYRCTTHPEEIKKPGGPGAHHFGVAADIACNGQQAFQLIEAGLKIGIWGIGISQRAGRPRFIHLDRHVHPARPNVWSY